MGGGLRRYRGRRLAWCNGLEKEGWSVTIFLKDPSATVDFAIDWSAGHGAGQTIDSAEWRVEPAGDGSITVDASRVEPDRTVATLSGGQRGCVYRISNAVLFSDGRRDERTLDLRVEDR